MESVTKEKVAKVKKEKVVKPKVELVSYSMKMVIPTGAYANIQPEIIVKAGTVEIAHDFIAPHMNKLWKEYYMISERKPEPVNSISDLKKLVPATEVEPASAVAYTKAFQAIQSCLSIEALNMIANQVKISVKLTDADKELLAPLLAKREEELHDATTEVSPT